MSTLINISGGKDCRGVPISYGDQRAIDGLEEAMLCGLAFRGDAIAKIDAVLAEHPQFIMGHLFKAMCLANDQIGVPTGYVAEEAFSHSV